ncbi:hypothetical protein COTS27_00280 [Spirochaetota bacterium]|nr:hypothetical protein COTS27_00280 [Spirochaetota bacterium]
MTIEHHKKDHEGYLLIIGASMEPERYSNKVFKLALKQGYSVLGVHPKGGNIDGHELFTNLGDVMHFIAGGTAAETTSNAVSSATSTTTSGNQVRRTAIDTISLYVRSAIALTMIDDFTKLVPKPRRIILNPGADAPEVADVLSRKGFNVVTACTLVLLHTGQY